MSTVRTNRSSKEKNIKSAPTQATSKTDGQTSNMKNQTRSNKAATAQSAKQDEKSGSSKNQPTQEQLRLAQVMAEGTKDEELKDKLNKVVELTGREMDDALIALHDCDYDLERAVMRLLENEDHQSEWQSAPAKKKKQVVTKSTEAEEITANHKPEKNEQHKRDRERDRDRDRDGERDNRDNRGGDRDRDGGTRGRRDRGPPRFNRGRGGRENNTDIDFQMTENRSRDRSFERGRGRGRGQGVARSRGRGRSSGGFGRAGNRFDKGPQIDTWTNETADNAEKENSIGAWGDMTEDWTTDEWTGPLDDIKVFTPSTNNQTEKSSVFHSPPAMNDNDASMFSAPSNLETQVFTPSTLAGTADNSALNDSTNTYQQNDAYQQNDPANSYQQNSLAESLTQNALSQNAIGSSPLGNSLPQASMGQSALVQGAIGPSGLGPSSMGQPPMPTESMVPSTLGQRLDLGILLPPKTADQQSQFLSQFAKQAEESIKNAVGIGSSSSSAVQQPGTIPSPRPSLPPLGMSQPGMTPPGMTPPGISQPGMPQPGMVPPGMQQSVMSQPGMPPAQSTVPQSQQQQQGNVQRPKRSSKLPPPSKIPASAVEMPGSMNFNLDVQFGNWGDTGFNFSGGPGPEAGVTTNGTVAVSSGSTQPQPLTNHLGQSNQAVSESNSIMQSAQMQSAPQPPASMGSLPGAESPGGRLDAMNQPSAPSPHTNVFHTVTSASPKEYSQSSLSQSNKISSQSGPIPFTASQAEHKTSPYGSQRTSQQTGAMTTSKPTSTSPMSYSQPGYSTTSGYPSTYKSAPPLTTSSDFALTSSTGSLSHQSGSSSGSISHQQGGLQGQGQYNKSYHSSSFPPQSSLYQNNNQSSSFQTPQGSSGYSGSTQGSQGSASYSANSQTAQGSSSFSGNSQSAQGSSGYSGSSQAAQGSSGYSGSSQTGQGSSGYSGSPSSSTGGPSYPSQGSNYHGRDSQAASTPYQPSASARDSQAASTPYQPSASARDSQSVSTAYQPSVSQATSYQVAVSQSVTPVYSTSQSSSVYQESQSTSQSSYSSQSYNGQSNLQTSPLSTTKLTDSLNKMSVKESQSIESGSVSGQYEHSTGSSTPSSSLPTTTSTISSSLPSGTVSVSSALGLTSPTTVTTASTSSVAASLQPSSTKSSLPVTTKAPPNLPPGVPPLIGHNYMIGQPGFPLAAFGLAQQPQVYSYEDLQLLQQQQRQLLPGYYDVPLQPPTTLPTRDATGLAAAVPYTAGADGKLSRMDAQSPVSAQNSQPQQQAQSAHQAFINPTLPPAAAYPNYYYAAGSVLPGGYSYTPTVFPQQVPSVTNTAHAGTTGTVQFQKPGAYGSHAYGTGFTETAGQTQDFTKAYGNVSQTAAKPSNSVVATSASDLASAGYGKAHAQSFDKAGFHAGTPPPYGLTMPTGTQAGPMAAPTGPYGTPYVPVLPHQQHSQMMHHHLQQDSTGGANRVAQPTVTPSKTGAAKNYSTAYWAN